MAEQLKGRTVFITGSGGVLGSTYVRRMLAEEPSEFDPRKYLKPAMAMMSEVCKARFEAFGTAGWADRIRPLSTEAMAKRY